MLFSLTALATPPSIVTVYPQTLPPGSSNQPIVLTGSNFLPGAVVLLNGTPLPTTVAGTTTIGSFLAASPSVISLISVRNGDGTVSNAYRLNVLQSTSSGSASPSGSTQETWYVRPDGGTRYSTRVTTGQCDGFTDAAYPGSGVNQHCAFKDVRYLWQDGSYPKSPTDFPAYGWIGKGGDTYLIRGSLGTGVSYRVGWNNAYNSYDSTSEQYWGLPGDPYDSGVPVPPSGTAAQPTQILGENYGSCTAASAKTQLHGGFGSYIVLDMRGASHVNVQCLDLTDFSPCSTVGSATTTCNKNIGMLSDFSQIGIAWNKGSTNDALTNVHVHGLSANGMWGPTGGGEVFSHLDLIGNSTSGWNADPGDGTTGSGSLLVQNFNISWNGCTEEYPIVHALPYTQCADDNVGGYGDGFGTATVASNPGWQAHFDQGVVSYNTQDGLDALHLTGTGSSMAITRVLAYANMGQQIKIGGQSGVAENNVIVTNCNALRQSIPGTPTGFNSKLSDFCRAADTGVAIAAGRGSTTVFDFNTIYSASSTGVEIDCQFGQTCDSTALIDYQNNIFLGFLNNAADGYWNGGNGEYSNPIYDTTGIWLLGNAGSRFSNNLTYHAKSNWRCPAQDETKSECIDPVLANETWPVYGYPDVRPTAASPVLNTGIPISGVGVDFSGGPRDSTPAIGAYE